MTVFRRTALLILAAAVLVAAVLAVRWFGRRPAAPAPSRSAAPVAAAGSPAPASVGNAPVAGADWMQPYRNLTLEQAFDIVARRVRFEPYRGVLRGARGTALAQGGNAIDQAMLLAAILRASGYEVRFVHGSLSAENIRVLLRGLYPPRMPAVSLAADYAPYQVADDERLSALVRDHYWLELNQGDTWLPLDPSFPRARVGEAYGTAAERFPEPPAALYQRLEFAWKIDTGLRPGQEVARWSGTVAELGLQPISLVVDAIPGSPKPPAPAQPSAGGMFGGALSGTPQPQPPAERQQTGAQPPSALRYVRAIETDSRRPATGTVSLASQPGSLIRRERLEIKLTGPGGLDRSIERTLYERSTDAPSWAAEHRRYTMLVVPGPVSQSYADAEIDRARGALKIDEWRGEMARLEAVASTPAGQKAAVERAAAIDSAVSKTAGYLMTLQFAARADALTDQIAYPNHVAVVRSIPRILIASSDTQGNTSATASTLSLDLRLDEVQAYAYPGFPSRAAFLFQTARGMQESVLEGELLAQWTGRPAVSTAALMKEARRNNVKLLAATATDRSALANAKDLTPRASAEIEATLAAGREVILPAQAITLEGRARWGWWDVDPDSGAVIGVMEGGQHQAMAEYSISSEKIALNDETAFYLGCIVGSNTTMFLVCGKLLETGTVTKELIEAVEAYVQQGACNSMCPSEASASAGVSVSADDCFSTGKSVGASASIEFCSKYNDGFKCAGSLILAGLKGEKAALSVSGSAEISLPDCGGK